jgi:hypothetical protein
MTMKDWFIGNKGVDNGTKGVLKKREISYDQKVRSSGLGRLIAWTLI